MKASIKEESNIYVLTLDTQDIAPSIITWNNNPKSFAYNNGKVNVTLSGSGCLLINNSTPCGFDEEESSESGVVCGNGLVETGEQCDLNNMSGATCTSLGYTEGTLSCSIRCTYEVNQCKYENPGNPGEEDPEDDTGFVFQELDGEVVLEAENFASGTVKQGIVWTIKNDPVFSNGAAMEAVPNKNKRSLKLSDGPVMSYEIKFTNSGIYYVWVRGRGPDINGDTVHVGLKGEEKANSDNMKGSTWRASLSWSKQTDDGARGIIEVKNARVETLLVGMKEDGFVVDKIILTKDPNFIPNLTGPSESIRN